MNIAVVIYYRHLLPSSDLLKRITFGFEGSSTCCGSSVHSFSWVSTFLRKHAWAQLCRNFLIWSQTQQHPDSVLIILGYFNKENLSQDQKYVSTLLIDTECFWGYFRRSGWAHSHFVYQFLWGHVHSLKTNLTYNNGEPWFTSKLRQIRQDKEDAYRKGDKGMQDITIYKTSSPSTVENQQQADNLADYQRQIIKDSSHPSHRLLSLLPSGRHLRSIRSCTSRLRDSFFPQAIRLMNSQN